MKDFCIKCNLRGGELRRSNRRPSVPNAAACSLNIAALAVREPFGTLRTVKRENSV